MDVLDPSFNPELDFPDEWQELLNLPVAQGLEVRDVPRLHFLNDCQMLLVTEVPNRQTMEPPRDENGAYDRNEKGEITYLGAIWVPPSLRRQILDATHLATPYWHPGCPKMKKIINKGTTGKGSMMTSKNTWEGV